VGDHYLNYAQGLAAGFCMACPESRETIEAGFARDRTNLLFRSTARFEDMLTRMMIRMEDAAGISGSFSIISRHRERYGEAILTGKPCRWRDGCSMLRTHDPL